MISGTRILGAAICLSIATAAIDAGASVTTYTSSTAFLAATSGTPSVENYSTGTAAETIANGGTFDGLTYSFTAGPSGTLTGGIVTNMFNSFSGLSLGGNQSNGAQFFFGQDSFTVAFATPVTEIGGFFNVNANSGNFSIATAVGTATTGSAAYDTSTFVFDGLISTTPFTSATFSSTDAALGSFNIPEILFVPAPVAAPEPASIALLLSGLAATGAIRRRKR